MEQYHDELSNMMMMMTEISINIAITMKLTNGKLHHPQYDNDDDDKNPEDTPTGKSSVGILGVCHHHDHHDHHPHPHHHHHLLASISTSLIPP